MPSEGVKIYHSLSRTLLLIDRVDNAEIEGRVISPYLPEPLAFRGVGGLTGRMEQVMDTVSYPEQLFRPRSFGKTPSKTEDGPAGQPVRYLDDSIFSSARGKVSTFIVAVQYRRNATWQGQLQCVEQDTAYQFSSALELFQLIEREVGGSPFTDWDYT